MIDLYEIEVQARKNGFAAICGVDEAGRGPLAGPVVAGAVILREELPIAGLNDSKKLSEKKREELFVQIKENALAWGVGIATEKEIDQINILQATFLAMQRAVQAVGVTPDLLLVDGNQKPPLTGEVETIVKGDGKAAAIAAASILAKVTRDNMMRELDRQYPQYLFAKHKGYPTKAHYEALKAHGVSAVHRVSFLKNLQEK